MIGPRKRAPSWLAAASLVTACASELPADQTTPADPAGIERTGRPNDYLVCPPGLNDAEIDREAPVFPVSVDRLEQAVIEVVNQAPRTEILSREAASRRYRVRQTSRWLGFSDQIDLSFHEIGAETSTVCIYSRAIHGYYDFGVNKDRVERWLAQVNVSGN
ncbi:MAG: DUF1499 domain-containing protein [Geminicoccaceae bacterium]